MKTINIQKAKKELNNKKYYEQFQVSLNQKYLSSDEMNLLLEEIGTQDRKNRVRNYLIFRLLYSTGCRIKEFSLIQIKHIDFNTQLITIPAENTKTNKSRVVRINIKLFLDLKTYLEDNNIKSGFIFRNKNTLENMTTRNYNYILDSYYNNIKSKLKFKPHVHSFRHTHIMSSINSGVPLPAVMKQVGHINLSTTQIYSDYIGTDIKNAYDNVSF